MYFACNPEVIIIKKIFFSNIFDIPFVWVGCCKAYLENNVLFVLSFFMIEVI